MPTASRNLSGRTAEHDRISHPAVYTESGGYRKCRGTVRLRPSGGDYRLCANVLLFAAKLVAGGLTGSLAIMADAFNNLSDAGSSIVTLVGFKLSSAPPDEEHPFGHGRMEYLSALGRLRR